MSRKLTGLILAACGCAVFAGGCAGSKVTRIRNEQEFREMVLASKKPVLVDFYKGGCATCVPLDKVMDQLVDEYKGRATIAKFEAMTAFFGVPSREIKDRYDIVFFPTVILFVNGEVKKPWIMRYSIENYRKELDKYVSPAGSDAGPDRDSDPQTGGQAGGGEARAMGEKKATLY